MTTRTIEERFWEKVAKSDGCWEWTGWHHSEGYGHFWVDGRMRRASHVAWEFTNGPIPTESLLLHRCDNPPCVRPDHLFLGTQSDNLQDAYRKGRGRVPARPIGPAGGVCRNGHPRTTLNTRLYRGWRRCLDCARVLA